VTAYSADGQESDFSNEIGHTVAWFPSAPQVAWSP